MRTPCGGSGRGGSGSTLNEAPEKKSQYRDDFINRHSHVISLMIVIVSTSDSGCLYSDFVRLLFLQAHRETDRSLAASGVHSSLFVLLATRETQCGPIQ